MASPHLRDGGSLGAHGRAVAAAVQAALCSLAGLAPAVLLSGCKLPKVEVPTLLKQGDAVSCPMGYVPHDGHLNKGGQVEAVSSMEECGDRCNEEQDCLSVEYSPSEKLCIWNNLGGRPEAGRLRDYQFCEKPPSPDVESLLLGPDEYVEQDGAQIQAGGNVRVYVVGSSNVLWMTWIDQLHLYLVRLGYKVPAVPAKTTNVTHYPSEPQTCDDTQYFTSLKTSRLGKIGWHSWDFAYEDWSDCENDDDKNYGWRYVANHKVKCEHGPGCAFGRQIVPMSRIAEDASWSTITLVTTWFNDDQPDAKKCFYGKEIPRKDIANMSITGLLKTTRAIHERNPDVWILILAKYTNLRRFTLPWIDDLHKLIKAAVEKEPRTLFIEYEKPYPGHWRAWELWQQAHPNHPNCRGSKLMAHSILERLYKEKILARSIKLVDKQENVNARNCHELSGAVCHTSVLCWKDPVDQVCKPYSGGSTKYYRHDELLGRNWQAFKK
mmetsp:Transcript_16821/g.46348  ORF Transcript_16821/g.46348 Transcript_16821/m.46348 type:complete len:493 (-) Transcript_16821:22-1500(-)